MGSETLTQTALPRPGAARVRWGRMTEQRIKTDGLRLDMYVSRLDSPWVETPFLF